MSVFALHRLWPILLTAALLPSPARADACSGLTHCRIDGSLRSQIVRVAVTDSGAAFHGVRTTLRLSNLGSAPLTLAYVSRSAQLTDDQGLAYGSAKALGIGNIDRDNADPQFQLAPGESRDIQIQQQLRYNARSTVVGTRFDQSLTLAQLIVLSGQRIHSEREYRLDFPDLNATDGVGAAPRAADVASPLGGAVPAAASDTCEAQGACQAQGPVLARIVGVNVSDGKGVTVFRTVRVAVRVRNTSDQPLILGYRVGSARLIDDQGLDYGWDRSGISESRYVQGIGQVTKDSSDTQFQLAPGESRDFQLERILEYNVRHTTPGSRFNLDFTLVRLAIVGPRQVRSLADYAMSFSGLGATNDPGSPSTGAQRAAELGNAVKGFFDLLKGKTK